MDETTLSDLKQFIAATISRQTTDIKQDIKLLDKKIDERTEEILTAVGDSTETRFEVIEQDISQIKVRLTKLEAA